MNFKINISVFFAALILISCNQNQKGETQANSTQEKIDTINVYTVARDTAHKNIVLPGNLLPNEKVEIRAKVQGYISSIKVDIGSKVSKGQILALIDAPEINTRLQELMAKSKSNYSRYLASKDYYERLSQASKSDGVIAASELENSKNKMLADEEEYKASNLAAASYRQIGNYLAIVSPYKGIITKRNVNIGTFVGNASDLPLFEMEDNSVLRLQVPVPELYSNALLVENTCEFVTKSFPDKKYKAKLTRKSGSIDEASRSELWEFEVPNADAELKAGAYVDIKLNFVRPQSSLVVPVSSVVSTLEKRFVIKVEQGKTKWVDVRNGFTMDDKQEIFGDLKEGDTLVLKANEELKSDKQVITKK